MATKLRHNPGNYTEVDNVRIFLVLNAALRKWFLKQKILGIQVQESLYGYMVYASKDFLRTLFGKGTSLSQTKFGESQS